MILITVVHWATSWRINFDWGVRKAQVHLKRKKALFKYALSFIIKRACTWRCNLNYRKSYNTYIIWHYKYLSWLYMYIHCISIGKRYFLKTCSRKFQALFPTRDTTRKILLDGITCNCPQSKFLAIKDIVYCNCFC